MPSDRTVVHLGNAAALMANGSPANIGNTITEVQMREGWDNVEEARLALSTPNDPILNLIARSIGKDTRERLSIGVLEVQNLWAAHSSGAPEWVESNDEGLAQAVADFFGCPVGRPDGFDASLSDDVLVALDAMTPPGEPPAGLKRAPMRGGALLNGGRDALHAQHYGTAAQPAAFNYLSLTANSTAPVATDTTMTGEITTAGGGLAPAQGTYAHSAGTNTTTLTKTFTANGSDSLPVTVAQVGCRNAAAAGGTLGYKALLNATATLNVVGDNVAVTYTFTVG